MPKTEEITLPTIPKPTQEEIQYAHQIIETITKACEKVTQSHGQQQIKLADQLVLELLKNYPELVEAILTITPPEHRSVIYNFALSIKEPIKIWLSNIQQVKSPLLSQ